MTQLPHRSGEIAPVCVFESPSDTQTGEISRRTDNTRTRSLAASMPPGCVGTPCGEAAMTAPLIVPLFPRVPGQAAGSTAGRPRSAACPSPPRRKSRWSRMTWCTGSAGWTSPAGSPTGP
jgi:hypothetical protein